MKFYLLLVLLFIASTVQAAETDVWIGTGDPQEGAAGIYHLTFDDQTGQLSPARLVAERAGAGFLAMHPTLPVMYST